MQKAAKAIISRLCYDRTWRNKTTSATDAEWLEFTNQLIKGYDEDISNVRKLLLCLGPKVPSSLEIDSTPVRTFFSQFGRLDINTSRDTERNL